MGFFFVSLLILLISGILILVLNCWFDFTYVFISSIVFTLVAVLQSRLFVPQRVTFLFPSGIFIILTGKCLNPLLKTIYLHA